MRAGRRFSGPLWRQVAGNVSARAIAIAGLTVATIMVARASGASGVGSYALLRMLPGLVGVLTVAGLPGALAYFLSPRHRTRVDLWPTIAALSLAGALVGTAGWIILAPVLRRAFFPQETGLLVTAAGVTVSTQLVMTLGKTALQGLEDRRGADIVIAAEEVAFVPFYALALLVLGPVSAAVVWALALADLAVGLGAWARVARAQRWRRLGLAAAPRGIVGRPDLGLAKDITSYGLRGQVGGVLNLLNTRLDFAILGAWAGPAVLGSYAIASKYAELLRLPSLALAWITYPRLAALDPGAASRRAVAMVRPALLGVAVAAVPVLLLAGPVTHLLYGDGFDSAVRPAQVLVLGMVLSGAAGAATGYLYGRGRPGLNSAILSLGLAVTVVLDIALIPGHGAMGAAVASCAAYLLSDGLLVIVLLVTRRRLTAPPHPVSPADAVETSAAEVAP
ncbi:MAG: polysaccharide biosynthesis C-terminal domain-containing protein [Marmoricola sp.]|nr:polysaccharide biosynthesis C-terminal domain-containing protein [Marmoricola sp.]